MYQDKQKHIPEGKSSPFKKVSNGSRRNPANEQAAACMPGVFENMSISKPVKKEKHNKLLRDISTGIFNIQYIYKKGVAMRK